MARAYVKVELVDHQLVVAIAELLSAIDHADPVLVTDEILEQAQNLRQSLVERPAW